LILRSLFSLRAAPSVILHQLVYFSEFFDYVFVASGFVRDQTGAAVLNAVFGVAKISAAVSVQHIEGAVAEKTVEAVRAVGFVAGEVLAFAVAKKGIAAYGGMIAHFNVPPHKIIVRTFHRTA
jgi:hypothetical protein